MEAPASPRPNGEREGPAPQAWEGEGEAQLPSRFRQQMRRWKLPLSFPSLTRWVPSSPRGARRKGASSTLRRFVLLLVVDLLEIGVDHLVVRLVGTAGRAAAR